jgi:hypothetical protein
VAGDETWSESSPDSSLPTNQRVVLMGPPLTSVPIGPSMGTPMKSLKSH